MTPFRLAAATALLLLPLSAQAQEIFSGGHQDAQQPTRNSRIDGNKLLQICTARNIALVQGCEAYINGVSDSVALYQHAASEPNSQVKLADTLCVPPDVTGAQLREGVVRWLGAHAGDRNHPSAAIVFHVLHETYPCH